MTSGDRAQDAPVTRQFLLCQCRPDAPQRWRELVQDHRVPDGQFPAEPVVFDKPPAHLPGLDVQVGPETPTVDQRCASLKAAQCSTDPVASTNTAPISRKLPLLS